MVSLPVRVRDVLIIAILVLGIVGLAVPAEAAQGQVIGSPNIELFTPEATFLPGETGSIQVNIANDGRLIRGGPAEYVDRVTTARATTIEPRSGSTPFVVRTGRISVGSVPEGTAGPHEVSIEVPEHVTPGTYHLPMRVRYTYTRIVSYDDDSVSYGDASADVTREIPVQIVDRARFVVESSTTNASVGGTGFLDLALSNRGTEAARDVTVTIETTDPDLRFGGDSNTARSHVSTWRPGETKHLHYRVSMDDLSISRSTAFTVSVDFRDPNGIRRMSEPLSTGLRPASKQTFGLIDVGSDLRIGDDGRIAGSLENQGPNRIDDTVIVITGDIAGVTPIQRDYPVGDIAPGETAEFSYPVRVSNTTRVGPRRLTVVADYRGVTGGRVRSDPLGTTVRVRSSQDKFHVEPVNGTFGVDSDNILSIRVTNRGNETVNDVEARLSVDEPLESDDSRSYIGRLEPGEETSVNFQLTVTDDALPKAHPVSVVFSYKTSLGTSRVSDRYTIPVTVQSQTGVDTPMITLGAAVLAFVLAVGWWLRRR